MMQRLILETQQIDGIPLITLGREDLTHAPIVFYIHGFGCNKADELDLGYMLARQGFLYVALDAPEHGDRLSERVKRRTAGRDYAYPPDTGLDVWVMLMSELVPQTARNVSTVIDWLSDDPRTDISRVGVAGTSMGGFTTFVLAATEPRISAAAPMISYPGFSRMWELYTAEAASYTRWSEAMSCAHAHIEQDTIAIRSVDPFGQLAQFVPKPLLMIQGDKDTDAPKHTSVMLYRSLRPLYTDRPDNLKLSIYDGVDHRVVREMLEEAAAWFTNHLAQ